MSKNSRMPDAERIRRRLLRAIERAKVVSGELSEALRESSFMEDQVYVPNCELDEARKMTDELLKYTDPSNAQ